MSRGRLPLLALGAMALLAAGWGGLSRIGVMPRLPGDSATYHGALMVSGFVGTLIALERAVVVRRWWAELAPALSGLGGIGMIVGVAEPLPALAIAAAALVLVGVTITGAPASPGLAVVLMSAGALAWAAGNGLMALGEPPVRSAPWWIGFVVLTIAAERVELSRALRPSARMTIVFGGACSILAIGIALTLVDPTWGIRIAGLGSLVLALWLSLRDRPPGAARTLPLPRYIAVAIAVGHAWLAVGALFMIGYDGVPAGGRYDAMLHAIFAGFVLSMIFAHGPIVIPAIAGVAIGYRRALYAPLAVLNVGLLARVAGDALDRSNLLDLGGALIGVAVLLFMGTMLSSLRTRRRQAVSASAT